MEKIKVFTICSILLLMLNFPTISYAQPLVSNSQTTDEQSDSELQTIADKYGIPTEQNNMKLVKIIIKYNNLESNSFNTSRINTIIKPQFAIPHDYVNLTDSIDVIGAAPFHSTSGVGPGSISCTISQGIEASFSANIGVSAGAVSAGVGFDVGATYEIADEQSLNLEEGQIGKIYAWALYTKYNFDVYHVPMFGNTYLSGSGSALKPTGVCFSVYVGDY